MSRRDVFDVAVVGAGMVGAAAALGLAKRGVRVALVEAQEPAQWRSEDDVGLRVSALSRASRDLLAQVGVWDAIAAARVAPFRRMCVWEEEGEIAFDAASEGLAELGHIVENALVADRLWAALKRESALEMHCPAQVAALSQESSHATLAFATGGSVRARVVVAADGASSPLRDMAGIDVDGRDYGQMGLVLHVQPERPHQDTAWQRFGPGGPLALLPLSDGRCSIVWTRPAAEARRLLDVADDELSERLTEASDARLGRLRVASPRAAFPLRLGLARTYQAGRLVLAGDAAHVVHPLAGQGVNLGFLDVAALMDVIGRARDAGRDIGAVDVLRRYARWRRSENAIAARSFDAIERLFGHEHPAVAALRRQGLAVADRIAPLKRFFMHRAGDGRWTS
ncbi:MAG TPA: UbiH/UbiF/VisC/COQ6 family ubiquinone biosynthesis hydroxylase [Xanthomonadaceae bacterium]|nr:UbiH/UbiF/VisC/COQ6 family ubiquinone biosynthesis hydroxylase [Xanthomonadaceae bacterium]